MSTINSIVLDAFQCDKNGISESYLGYKWYEGLTKKLSVSLVTGNKEYKHLKDSIYVPYSQWNVKRNGLIGSINSAIKVDYFIYNKLAKVKLRNVIKKADLLHHVSPVAPRYPVGMSAYSQKFILGPVAGGLSVPKSFCKEVEGSEELFHKLKKLDSIRFKIDRSLKYTYDRAEKIIIAGDYLLNILPSRYHDKCTKMLDVGIDINEYTFIERSTSSVTFNLLYVGRVVPYKGLIYLLKSLTRLPNHVKSSIRLNIAGNTGHGSYESECKRFIEQNKLSRIVKFHGFLTKDKVRALYANSHLFCFPSLAEAGGTVVLEALAMGLPVLGVDYGGPGESVDDSCGILITPKNPNYLIDMLALNIDRYFYDLPKVELMSESARLKAERDFDWDKRCKKMLEIYSS